MQHLSHSARSLASCDDVQTTVSQLSSRRPLANRNLHPTQTPPSYQSLIHRTRTPFSAFPSRKKDERVLELCVCCWVGGNGGLLIDRLERDQQSESVGRGGPTREQIGKDTKSDLSDCRLFLPSTFVFVFHQQHSTCVAFSAATTTRATSPHTGQRLSLVRSASVTVAPIGRVVTWPRTRFLSMSVWPLSVLVSSRI